MTKQGWALYPEYTLYNKNHAFDWLREEAAACDIDLGIHFFEEMLITADGRCLRSGEEHPRPDFVLMRGYESRISRYFELQGIPVFNTTESMLRSRDKMLTNQFLNAACIPTPLTCYLSGGNYSYSELCYVFDSNTFVIKHIEGSKGDNVYLINSEEEMFEALEAEDSNCLAQEYISTSHGRDVRVWVVGDQAVAAVLRYSDTDFRSNFAQGGQVKAFDLPPEAAALAVQAARMLSLDFAGVDLLFTHDGFTVCEVNGNAGFRSLSALGTPVNLPKLIFRHILDRLG